MSPSEQDLRAALHRDEGEPLDVGHAVAAGAAAHDRRRTRLVTGAASVVLVVAIAGAGAALLGRDDTSSAPAAAPRSDSARTQAGGRETSAASSNVPGADLGPAGTGSTSAADPAGNPAGNPAGTGVTPAACPAAFPRRMLPGGGSVGQFGADSPLFARTPTVVTACAYSAAGAVTGRVVFAGRDAAALRASLESASRRPTPCPVAPAHAGRTLAFVGIDAAGRSLRIVTTTVTATDCNSRTTNGTAVRYDWTPPAGLSDRLALLGTTVDPRQPTPSGKIIGSPVR